MTRLVHRGARFLVSGLALAVLTSIFVSCTHNIPRFGVGGRYEEGRDQFLRGRGGDMDKAVAALEYVVSQDPTYKKSLTYLGRAYYRKSRYKDAFAILQRAVALNNEDEIAWIALGLTQLQLGQDDKGVETLKGGVTLASKVMVGGQYPGDGYLNYMYWDNKGTVRAALRRSAFLLTKGLDEKKNIIQATDRLLAVVDDEENFQKNTLIQHTNPLYQ